MAKGNKILSTFEREMQDKGFAKSFDKGYNEFLLSEVLIDLMKEGSVSVRGLAQKSGVAPSIIQALRSGSRKNITYKNLANIMNALGYSLIVKKGKKQIKIA